MLLSPRGEFGSAALQRRSLKKRIYIQVFRMLGLPGRVVWHSTAPHETADIRALWGEDATIIERGNDTLLAHTALEPQVAAGPLRAVFLGRIVKHKGLHIALEALHGVSSAVRLDIYGSREDDAYVADCEKIVQTLPDNVEVHFHGPIAPEKVVETLNRHDVLLMPTAGENFGHVIAEALAASCEVAVTPLTPWTEQLSRGGGILLDRTPAAWREGIESLAARPLKDRLEARGRAGRTYELWMGRPRPEHLWVQAFELISVDR